MTKKKKQSKSAPTPPGTKPTIEATETTIKVPAGASSIFLVEKAETVRLRFETGKGRVFSYLFTRENPKNIQAWGLALINTGELLLKRYCPEPGER